MAALAGSGAALITLAACYGAPPYVDTCVDQDGDGWLPGCYNDDLSCDPDDINCDCRDYDPGVHPGVYDPIDGVDRDCDGTDMQGPLGVLVDAGVVPDAWIPDDSGSPDAP